MNQRDRKIAVRAYDVLVGTSRLRARNPADIKTISLYHAHLDGIVKSVAYALIDLCAGDPDLAADQLEDAERLLADARR